jgi:hypothetical protein
MSESKTLDDWYPDGRGDGRKFFSQQRYGNYEPVFRCKDTRRWHAIDDRGYHVELLEGEYFKEYVPPKKKVEKWLWAYPSGSRAGEYCWTEHFYADNEAKSHWIKIEGTRIEVDEV